MITAIIIAYNNEDYIADAVASALKQNPPFEKVVVVEDRSTDSTFSILSEICADDPSVQLIRHASNLGPGPARNTGMFAIQTEFFCFLDGDDLFFDDATQKFHKAIVDNTDTDLWMFQGKRFTDTRQGRIVAKIPPAIFSTLEEKKAILRSVTFPWNKLYRTAFVQNHNISFPTGKYEDIPWCYACRVLASRIVGVAEPIIRYRIHPESTLNRVSDHHLTALDQWKKVFEMVQSDPSLSAALFSFVRVSCFIQLTGILFSKRLPTARQPEFATEIATLLGPISKLRRDVRTDPERDKVLTRFRKFRKYLENHATQGEKRGP